MSFKSLQLFVMDLRKVSVSRSYNGQVTPICCLEEGTHWAVLCKEAADGLGPRAVKHRDGVKDPAPIRAPSHGSEQCSLGLERARAEKPCVSSYCGFPETWP